MAGLGGGVPTTRSPDSSEEKIASQFDTEVERLAENPGLGPGPNMRWLHWSHPSTPREAACSVL